MFSCSYRRFCYTLILFILISSGLSAKIRFNTQSSYRYLKGIDAAGLSLNWNDTDFDDSGWTTAVAPFRFGDGSGQPELPELLDTIGLQFSHLSGFITENFELSVMSPVEDAEIIYTLDGSNPQSSITALRGTSPLIIPIDPGSGLNRSLTPAVVVRASIIKDGFGASKPLARTFINLEHVKSQSHPGGGWPAYNSSDKNRQYMDYEMDPEVVNNNLYKDKIDGALLDLPTISVITDNANLFNLDTGIYVNAEGQGTEWERECSVELINPDLSEGFNVNAGLRIRGGWSRHNNYPKHAFRLFFREEYGAAKLSFPLFEDEGVSKFDKIDLRCAQNYSWANNSNSTYNTFVREVFTRDSQRDVGQPYTRSRYYHLYLNGMYWGIYQTQERSEARFASDYFGGDNEDYDVIKISGLDYSKEIVATDGTLDKWKEIFDFTKKGFASNKDYFMLEGKDESGRGIPGAEVFVDLDNLIDYMINIIYSGNYDSPVSGWGGNKRPNNMYAITNRERKSSGFRFFIHDGEHTLMNDATAGPGIGLYENRADIGDRTGNDRMLVYEFPYFHSQWLHYKLTKNEEYRIRFANRAWQQLTGKGIFTPEVSTERFNRRAEEIELAIIAESARWGDTQSSAPYTKDNAWLPQLDMVRDDYFPVRPGIVMDQLKALDLFPSLAAPIIKADGQVIEDPVMQISSSIILTLSREGSSGEIYYSLDGSDPRDIGGNVSSSASKIASGGALDLSSSSILRSRVLSNNNWSAEKCITIVKEQSDYSDLKVTEIHYHPLDSINGIDTISGKSFEFIEFKNVNPDLGLNLSGLLVDSAVYYEFPEASVLPPDSYFVIAAKPTSFFERYGMDASGNYQKNLSNGGEQVVVRTPGGELLIDFTYEDEAPWPTEPDGKGSSLASVDINPRGDPNDPLYWTAGRRLHGTPFSYDLILGEEEEMSVVNEFSMQLYPNPTRDLFMVQVSGDDGYTTYLTLYDLQGKVLYSEAFDSYTELSMDALNVSHGIYLVEISSPAGRLLKKVVYTP